MLSKCSTDYFDQKCEIKLKTWGWKTYVQKESHFSGISVVELKRLSITLFFKILPFDKIEGGITSGGYFIEFQLKLVKSSLNKFTVMILIITFLLFKPNASNETLSLTIHWKTFPMLKNGTLGIFDEIWIWHNFWWDLNLRKHIW